MIPYGRHQIDSADIDSVVEVLKSDWLTTGPRIEEFEKAVARYSGTPHAVAVSSGTAALHCAAYAVGIGPGDEVIVPAVTFAATANCVIALGGKPVIVDVDPETLLLDVNQAAAQLTSRTKAIIAVDFAGQACDYSALRRVADEYHLGLVSDSCHALGATHAKRPIGQWADIAAFSFHPVKHITTGEGGAIVTGSSKLADRIRRFRNHGIGADLHERQKKGTWHYQVEDLGFNYRLSDFQCALGLSQLKKAGLWLQRRRTIAGQYDSAFRLDATVEPLEVRKPREHAYHLYIVRVGGKKSTRTRNEIFSAMRDKGIGVNVHYIPLNLHPYYQHHFGARPGQCPVAEAAYETILSLPIFPAMGEKDIRFVVESLREIING